MSALAKVCVIAAPITIAVDISSLVYAYKKENHSIKICTDAIEDLKKRKSYLKQRVTHFKDIMSYLSNKEQVERRRLEEARRLEEQRRLKEIEEQRRLEEIEEQRRLEEIEEQKRLKAVQLKKKQKLKVALASLVIGFAALIDHFEMSVRRLIK